MNELPALPDSGRSPLNMHIRINHPCAGTYSHITYRRACNSKVCAVMYADMNLVLL